MGGDGDDAKGGDGELGHLGASPLGPSADRSPTSGAEPEPPTTAGLIEPPTPAGLIDPPTPAGLIDPPTPAGLIDPTGPAATPGTSDLPRLAYLSRIVEQIQEGVGVADMTGRITYVNPAGAAMLGYTVDELVGQDVALLHHPDAYRSVVQLREEASRHGSASGLVEHRRKDGTTFVADSTISLLYDDAGSPIGLVRTVHDVTAELALLGDRQAAEQRLQAILLTMRDLVVMLSPTGEASYASPSFSEALGYDPAELVGTNIFALVHPDDLQPAAARAAERLGEAPGVPVQPIEVRLRTASGDYVWYEAVANPMPSADGSATELLVSLRTIHDRKQREDHLTWLARTDPLTGLTNRLGLLEQLEELLHDDRAQPLAVLFVDLDGFKDVNDGFGHQTGDLVLVEVGRRLASCVRQHDLVARLGGDEFVLLLRSAPADLPAVMAERVAAAVSRPFTVSDTELSLSASVGVARPDLAAGAQQVLWDADRAMYQAKLRREVATAPPAPLPSAALPPVRATGRPPRGAPRGEPGCAPGG